MKEEQKQPIRILIVDDHPGVRSSLAFSLEVFDDMEIAGEAANGREALRRCRLIQPDVILMDLIMPGMDGITATRQIRHRYPTIPVLGLSQASGQEKIGRMMEAGAAGFVPKTTPIDELVAAIRAVLRDAPQDDSKAGPVPPEMINKKEDHDATARKTDRHTG